MAYRISQLAFIGSLVLLVSIVVASGEQDSTQSKQRQLLAPHSAHVQFDVVLPVHTAKLLTEIVTKHGKTDKVSVTVNEIGDGTAKLTIAGEQEHAGTVWKFATLLRGELQTTEERMRESIEMTKKFFREPRPVISLRQ